MKARLDFIKNRLESILFALAYLTHISFVQMDAFGQQCAPHQVIDVAVTAIT